MISMIGKDLLYFRVRPTLCSSYWMVMVYHLDLMQGSGQEVVFCFLNGVVESFSLIITSTAHLIAIDKMGSNLNGTVLFDPFLVYNNNQVLLVGGAIGTH